jgi:plastocyanin
MSSLKAVLAVAVVAVVIAGCGEDKEGSVNVEGSGTSTTGTTGGTSTSPTATTEVPPVGAPVATIKLKMTDFALDPQDPQVAEPGIVLIEATNAGKSPHAIEVEGPDGEAETPTLAPGKKANLKVNLDKDGSYVWYCPVGNHKDMGMEGKITVGKDGGTTTGGTATSDDSGSGSGGSGSDDSKPTY